MNIQNIRNFSIIAHIDHGKSTLADRILELTGSVSKRGNYDRIMDTLELEQEKGITIKLQTARMNWQYTGIKTDFKNKNYILNLIDTPGHVDFSYEVSRSVKASEGVILLVDATQGIQAQTISNFYKALENNLVIIPVITKIDLKIAQIEKTKASIKSILGFNEGEILEVSGRTGDGVEKLLNEIVEKIPSPVEAKEPQTKLFVFDSFFHEHKGVVVLVKTFGGFIKNTDILYALNSRHRLEPIEIGYLKPNFEKTDQLLEGEVGYIATGLKDIKSIHVGDTITKISQKEETQPLEGYYPPKPMIFASLYPIDNQKFTQFSQNLEKLALNDASLTYTKETSPVLGTGYCVGFLGLLHLEITQERLSREFETEIFTTTPSVLYKVKTITKNLEKLNVSSNNAFDEEGFLLVRTASEFPKREFIDQIYEPWVNLEIITPLEFMASLINLVKEHRGIYKSTEYLNSSKNSNIFDYIIVKFEIPTAEIITNFFDTLKSKSSGYASMDYTHIGYRPSDIEKVTILLNHEPIEALSFLTYSKFASKRGQAIVSKLVEVIPRQQFEIPVQAAIGGKFIARETIRAYRKDVLEKLYGGDVSRKKKQLEKQKKGKERLKKFGKVEVPREAFLAVLKTD